MFHATRAPLLFHHDSSPALRWTTPRLDTAGLSITSASSSYAGAFRNLTRLLLCWPLEGSWEPGLSEKSSWRNKLTKSAGDAAQTQAQAVELWDTPVPSFLRKIAPSGRKVFMLQYRTKAGERRKAALGQYGELTVEQARSLVQEWLAQVRRGGDPGAAGAEARKAPTVEGLRKKFMEDDSRKCNKPSTRVGYQGVIDRCVIPLQGRKKAHDVKRPDIAGLMEKLSYKQAEANKAFSILRNMFNSAEVWGYRPDGSNPCRHVPMFSAGKSTHLISDEDMGKLFRQLDKIEAEELEDYVNPLAIRLQFEFAGRRSEIVTLEWEWVDLEIRRIVWPDSKTVGMSKPISEEGYRPLSTAPRQEGNPYVLPSPRHPGRHLTTGEYYGGWSRALKAAGATHVGTRGIRHRSATGGRAATRYRGVSPPIR